MLKFLVVFALVAVVALAATSFAAVSLPVVLTNDDNPTAGGNTATVFHLNTSTGQMSVVKVFKTGGTGLGGGFFANTGSAIASNAACVFVTDTASDEIAAFKAPSYVHVTPNVGIPGMFSTFEAGGSIALSPNGKLLASGNGGTMNISLWSVGTGCVLTHVADYVPSLGADSYSPLGFTPNGEALVVPSLDFEGAEIFKVNANGTLTDVNNVVWTGLGSCQDLGCFPSGLDFTSDSKLVVFGNASGGQNSVLSAKITAKGLTSPQNWPITACPQSCGNPNVPWFSKNGAKGNGELYVGMSGFSPDGVASGEVTMNFVESPLSITEEGSATFVSTPQQAAGAIRSIGATGDGTGGGILVYALYPNQIATFTIGAGGTITPGPVTTDANGQGLLSISVYPNTR